MACLLVQLVRCESDAWSRHRHPAVDSEGVADDVARPGAAKPQHGRGNLFGPARTVMVGEIPWRGPGVTDCRSEAVAPLASPRRESTMAGPLTAVVGPRWEASGVHRHGELGRD